MLEFVGDADMIVELPNIASSKMDLFWVSRLREFCVGILLTLVGRFQFLLAMVIANFDLKEIIGV